MKRDKNLKAIFSICLMFVGMTMFFTSCSKDEKEPETGSGSIDEVIGTFKGTIDIVGGEKKFNELLEISKVSDNKVKVTVKNSSLKLPVKEVQVYNNSGRGILTESSEPQGILVYSNSNKALSFVSKVTAEGEEMYSFEGSKQ
ncbi:hypothetical protein [Sphingobacterium mizutaii]|uniref:hypothetical protein n=1 Tax=Sphingobacterium mizutaii TaxID=1010 RepID=UPI0016247617|nr:hypothetical protein [Sphingobacterium mizutaii]